MQIFEPTTAEQLQDTASLMREFLQWTHIRFADMPEVVAGYYDMEAWNRELDNLSAEYQRPDGGLLLAIAEHAAIGCVALRRFDDEICEMKRLFVSPNGHRRGTGRALCMALFEMGRELGYSHMRLETGDLQTEAQTLYRKLGFAEIPPYRTHPEFLLDHMVCMERAL